MLIPWKELSSIDQKVFFISDWFRQESLPLTHLCQRYSISRKTGYKWSKRYQELGFEGLHEQSCKPHDCPTQVPFGIRKKIIELRTQ